MGAPRGSDDQKSAWQGGKLLIEKRIFETTRVAGFLVMAISGNCGSCSSAGSWFTDRWVRHKILIVTANFRESNR